MAQILTPSFFDRDAAIVARALLGCTLCVRDKNGVRREMIMETEAYVGPEDLASHASKGRTKRTEVLFQKPGTIYVYLIYGIHEMLNIVTGAKEYPAAVLIRGVGTYSGPGKLTHALGITRACNNMQLGTKTGVWIERGGVPAGATISATPRIGVSYAKQWANTPLRFVLRTV